MNAQHIVTSSLLEKFIVNVISTLWSKQHKEVLGRSQDFGLPWTSAGVKKAVLVACTAVRPLKPEAESLIPDNPDIKLFPWTSH